jgi:hypothetical protein
MHNKRSGRVESRNNSLHNGSATPLVVGSLDAAPGNRFGYPLHSFHLLFFEKSLFFNRLLRSDNGHFGLFLASLLSIHFMNLLFHDANGFVEPVGIATHPLDFNGGKPFAGVLRGLAQRLEMCGPHQERQVIIRPAEN